MTLIHGPNHLFFCYSGEESSSSSEEESNDSDNSVDFEESSEDDANHKKKGVQGLIEIENPNRAVKKSAEKVTKVDVNAAGSSKPDLSRREREELEKQRAQAHYQKMHAEGKTEQARADLARLAIIKQVIIAVVFIFSKWHDIELIIVSNFFLASS